MAKPALILSTILLTVLSVLSACKQGAFMQTSEAEANNAELTPWLNQLIQSLKQAPATNPPAKIYRYTYNNQVVFYMPGYCCDVPGKLYDADGNKICEPDGGITGRGDGLCTDFFEKRNNETLIWEDKRES